MAITPNTPQTSTSNPSTSGMIRNLNQTVQEREIIKTAPDLIIYLDGVTYLLNPYITNTTQGQQSTFVSFNDYLQNFSASYDIDSLVPSGNFTLQVPAHMKYLFQAPGGNNLIESMMEVQVYAKGYFPSGDGNTIYHRIFKGVTSHISHTDNGMFLEISVQCLGVMHLMEYMYVDLNPALLSNSDHAVLPYTSNQFNMNPYEMLADTFLRGITFEGFQLNVFQQGNIAGSQWGDAVAAGYCNKWQPILVNLRKEVHILGYNMGDVYESDINGITSSSLDAKGHMAPSSRAARATRYTSLSQIATNPDYYVDKIRAYLPDMGIGSIQLTNGRITSRLERIRTIVQLIGYEGFQDLDGTIIFKPPLYNLDVTNINGMAGSTTQPTTGNSPNVPTSPVNITDATNPFVVHLSEIETESESEDQQAIKATRVSIQPDWVNNVKLIQEGTGLMRPLATHIDIPKMSQFGLREEPARTLGWLSLQDKVDAYAYAVSELNRANRGWRTYNLTIPLRPELKLGFPMYLPHKDMYGYIKTISISYSVAGAATMSVMLDTLRKRPLFSSNQTNSNQSSSNTQSTLYTTQPSLVMQWTTPPSTSNASSTHVAYDPTTGNIIAEELNANLLNNPATQVQPQAKPIYPEETEVISAQKSQYGTSWATKADTRSKCFRVQNDKATADDANNKNGNGSNISAGSPFFSATNWYGSSNSGINMTYLQKILSSQPYTDEGGYELITPFPWGRWKNLKEAIYETHQGLLVDNATSDQTQIIPAASVFLAAGVGSPNSLTGASSTLQSQITTLSNLSNQVSSSTSFELQTPQPGQVQNIDLNSPQPDSILLQQVEINTESATDAFLIGNIPPQQGSALAQALNAAATNDTTSTELNPITAATTPIINPDVVGTTISNPQTQSQAFITKILNSGSTTQ